MDFAAIPADAVALSRSTTTRTPVDALGRGRGRQKRCDLKLLKHRSIWSHEALSPTARGWPVSMARAHVCPVYMCD